MITDELCPVYVFFQSILSRISYSVKSLFDPITPQWLSKKSEGTPVDGQYDIWIVKNILFVTLLKVLVVVCLLYSLGNIFCSTGCP